MLASYRFSQRTVRGVTLLEMLVVLVIFGMLAGLVGPRLFKSVEKSSLTAASVQIKTLRGAVENLRLDIGRYPSAEEGLALLSKPPADAATAARWRGPYLEEATVPLDPWNSPYQYSIPGRDGLPFALYSWGADRQPVGPRPPRSASFESRRFSIRISQWLWAPLIVSTSRTISHPSLGRSTRKALLPAWGISGLVLGARDQDREACAPRAPEMNHLWPFTSQLIAVGHRARLDQRRVGARDLGLGHREAGADRALA